MLPVLRPASRSRIVALRHAALLFLLAAGSALAHDPFEITTEAWLKPDALVLEVVMSRSTALAVATGHEGPGFPPADFPKLLPGFSACAPQLFIILAGDQPLVLRSGQVTLGRENDVEFHLVYPRPGPGPLQLRARHVTNLPMGYGAILTLHGEDGALLGQKLLTGSETTLAVIVPSVTSGGPPAAGPSFREFLVLGIGHILTGYDHLLFLLGLLVACRRLRTMIVIITCFTLAHSITLALAALGLVVIPSRIVEPLIAASIVFVGVENLVRREEPPHRWLLAFFFGLIHGFGFASALREAGLGQSGAALAVPLFSFNLGVELGQLGLVAVVFPLLLWLRARPAFVRVGPPVVSALVAVAGLFWLLQRTVFS